MEYEADGWRDVLGTGVDIELLSSIKRERLPESVELRSRAIVEAYSNADNTEPVEAQNAPGEPASMLSFSNESLTRLQDFHASPGLRIQALQERNRDDES